MTNLTIRNIDSTLDKSLRQSAARHGRSLEEEARQILLQSLKQEKTSTGLGTRISQRFASTGGVDFPEVTRSIPRPPC